MNLFDSDALFIEIGDCYDVFLWYFPYVTFSVLLYNVCCYQNSLLVVNHFNVISVSQDSKADPGQQTIKIWKYESTV